MTSNASYVQYIGQNVMIKLYVPIIIWDNLYRKFIKPKQYIWLSLKSDICQFCQNRASYTYYSQLEMSIRFIFIFKNESKTETKKFWTISEKVISDFFSEFWTFSWSKYTDKPVWNNLYGVQKTCVIFWNYKTFIIGDKNNLSALH